MKKTQLFISGIPGCGKSTFGRWLAEQKQFTYVDMEHDGLDEHGFRASWDTFCDSSDTKSFIAAIRAHPTSVVLDWGFPPSQVHLVQKLKDAGLRMFWFEGDRLATRFYFVQCGTVPVSAFDSQYSQISSQWHKIEPIFGDNVVKTVHTDGTRLSSNVIFTQVFGRWI